MMSSKRTSGEMANDDRFLGFSCLHGDSVEHVSLSAVSVGFAWEVGTSLSPRPDFDPLSPLALPLWQSEKDVSDMDIRAALTR